MYDRILVPLDGSKRSEAVLPYVRSLATALGARITLLRATEVNEEFLALEYVGPMADARIKDHRDRAQLEAEEALSRIAASMGSIEVDTVITGDPPAEAIAKAAGNGDPTTLIAMSTRGRTGISRWVMGSVTDRVLHSSASSMLIVRPDIEEGQLERESWKQGDSFMLHLLRPDIPEVDLSGSAHIDTLVVPLDGSEVSEGGISTATALAKRLGAGLLLLRAATSAVQMSIASEWPAGYPDLMTAVEEGARVYLDAKAEELAGSGVSSVNTLVATGEPAAVIAETVQAQGDSVVVMTSRGRSGISRALLGSVADRVLTTCPAPVLLLRPL